MSGVGGCGSYLEKKIQWLLNYLKNSKFKNLSKNLIKKGKKDGNLFNLIIEIE